MSISKSLSLHACTKYKEETLHFTYPQVEMVSDGGLNRLINMYTVTYFMPVPKQKCSGTNYCHAVLCHCHKCEHNLTVSGNVGSAQIAWKNFAFFWWLQCHIIWFEWGWEMTKAGNLASWRFYGGDVCSSIAFTLLHRLLFKLFYTCHHFVTFVGRMSLKTLMEKDRSLLQKEEEPLMRYILYIQEWV